MIKLALLFLAAVVAGIVLTLWLVNPQLVTQLSFVAGATLAAAGVISCSFIIGVLCGRKELNEVRNTYQRRLTELSRQNEAATQRFLRQGSDLEKCRQRNVDLDRKVLGLHRQLTDSQIPLLTQVDDLAKQMVDDGDYLINHRSSRPAKQQRVAGHEDGASIQQTSLIQALTTTSSPLRSRVDDSCDSPSRANDSSPSSSPSSSSDSGGSSSCD